LPIVSTDQAKMIFQEVREVKPYLRFVDLPN